MLIQKIDGASDLLRWYLILYKKFNKIKWFPATVFVKMHTNKQPNLKSKYM